MSEIIFSKELRAEPTPIEGLVVYDLPVHGDNRGWFKENWQQEKMTTEAVGLPDFGPVQNNVSYNTERGVTRGLHAEPWDKYVSIGAGEVFGAWVDLRQDSDTFGQVFTTTLDPSKAIFVPRGVANGFQTLTDGTVYMYLVNDHWSPDAKYANVNIADSSLGINWPIPLDQAEISEKDKHHPALAQADTIAPKKILITGAYGQLGRALQELYPDAECVDRDTLDIASDDVFTARRWRDYQIILNAAAYTAVDMAETPEGRKACWEANAKAVANLARIATQYHLTLVHISSDYVFDGTETEHLETENFSPLSVYGAAKAAGDIAASTAPQHYIMRTSWVIGQGNNFVRTMAGLADRGVDPTVVNDQIGRLTFTGTLAESIKHLLDSRAAYGTYNISNSGPSASWQEIAQQVYNLTGHDPARVSGTTTDEYFAGKDNIAPRPLQSTLNIDKIVQAGYQPTDWRDELQQYLAKEN